MATDLVVYGMKGSPFVRKVLVVLAEKNLPYDFEMASPFPAPDWFVEMNPAKRIPVLRDRTVGTEGAAGTIPDSSAICAYLERKYPQPAVYPTNHFDYGRALWLEEYADTELAMRVGLGLFRPLVMAKMFGKEPDIERARKTVTQDLPPLFDYLEKSLGGGTFLVGNALSIADIAVATQLVNLQHAGASVDAGRWPKLNAFGERLHARPSFANCIAEEKQFIPQVTLEL